MDLPLEISSHDFFSFFSSQLPPREDLLTEKKILKIFFLKKGLGYGSSSRDDAPTQLTKRNDPDISREDLLTEKKKLKIIFEEGSGLWNRGSSVSRYLLMIFFPLLFPSSSPGRIY
jgi:hypothetical protein